MYKFSSDFFSDEAEGEVILLDENRGVYYIMSGAATAVANNLANGYTVAEIAENFKRAAGCPADIENGVNYVLTECLKAGILVEADSGNKGDFVLPAENEWDFNIETYGDLEEFFKDDPIHDVSWQKGWPTRA